MMKNGMTRMKRIAAACLVLLLLALLPVSSLADLKRGDRGEEVKALQQMLIDIGFLSDKADGVFGKKTEAAVKDLQAYWGMDGDGVVDSDMMNSLTFLWQNAMDVATESSLPEVDLQLMYPSSCGWYEDELGYTCTEHCYRHYRQENAMVPLAAGNPPEKLQRLLAERVCRLWLSDIDEMYGEWEASLPAEDRHIAREQKQSFHDAYSAQKQQWARDWGSGSVMALIQEMLWLDEMGAGLCFDLHGAEPNP